jgi:hypothetical protein
MIKRLFGAIVTGVGLRAGEDIYEEGRKRIKEELRRLPQEKTPRQLAKAARVAEKERAAAAKDRARTVEAELAALKKKMGR